MAVRIDSGIDVMTMIMLRGEPRNSSTMIATSVAADDGLAHHVAQRARTNCDWSNVSDTFMPSGAVGSDVGHLGLDVLDDRQRRSGGMLDDQQVSRLLAVEAHDVGLRLMRVGDGRNVAEEHRRHHYHLHRQLVEFLDVSGLPCSGST